MDTTTTAVINELTAELQKLSALNTTEAYLTGEYVGDLRALLEHLRAVREEVQRLSAPAPTTAAPTRRVTLSARRVAEEGAAYTEQFLGLQVLFVTWEGDAMVGTLTHFTNGYPVATFADGRHARLDLDLTVID